MLDYAKIGDQIRKIRKNRGLTQEQLAEKVWISVTHMSHIETGQTKLSLPVLVDLANALEVTPNDLLAEQFSALSQIFDDMRSDTCSTSAQDAVLRHILQAAKAAMELYL